MQFIFQVQPVWPVLTVDILTSLLTTPSPVPSEMSCPCTRISLGSTQISLPSPCQFSSHVGLHFYFLKYVTYKKGCGLNSEDDYDCNW